MDKLIAEEPITECYRTNGVLNIWYYCPNCMAFQFPEYKDIKDNIGVCKYCSQNIDYKKYIK